MKKASKKILLFGAIILISVFSYAQNVGVGTTAPNSKLHVASTSASDSVALKVSVDNATKLKVTSNGGVAIGTVSNPPANGLLVNGILQPDDSIKNSAQPIYIISVNDSVVLKAGNTTITLSASGAVKIKSNGTGNISIDGGSGNVSISGATVSISASTTLNLTGINTTVSGLANANLFAPIVKIGSSSSSTPLARLGDAVVGAASGSAVTGSIVSGSSSIFVQ